MVNKISFSGSLAEEYVIPETDASREFLNLIINELKEVYGSERQLAKALPKMHKAAAAAGLKEFFASNLSNTQLQVERMEQVLETLGETLRVKKCEAMAGLIEEAISAIQATEKGTQARDTSLVLATQKISNYENTSYTLLVQLARTMGNEDIISLLEDTLSEEKETHELLSALADGANH